MAQHRDLGAFWYCSPASVPRNKQKEKASLAAEQYSRPTTVAFGIAIMFDLDGSKRVISDNVVPDASMPRIQTTFAQAMNGTM